MPTDNAIAVTDKLREEAKRHEDAALEAFHGFKLNAWQLTIHCSAIKEKNLFRYLGGGYESFEAWREAHRIGRSSILRNFKIRNYLLPRIPDGELEQMTMENAELLTQVKLENITDDLIQDAKSMKERDLTEKVHALLQRVHRQEQLRAQRENAVEAEVRAIEAPAEKRIPVKHYMYVSQSKMFEQTIEDVEKKYNLGDNPGRAVEIICGNHLASELNDAAQVVAYLTPELRHIHGLMNEICDQVDNSQLSSDETLEIVKKIAKDAQEVLTKAILTVAQTQ